MLEVFGLDVSARVLVDLMLSFSFFVGLILVVSREAFGAFHKALQKEYGLKRRLAPKLEDSGSDIIDKILMKYRVFAGLIISITAFFLLLAYR